MSGEDLNEDPEEHQGSRWVVGISTRIRASSKDLEEDLDER